MKKKQFLLTVIICVIVLAAATLHTGFWGSAQYKGVIRVGFVYSEDESTPYTANFVKAQRALEEEYSGRVEVLVKSNVLGKNAEQPIRELIRQDVKIIFINLDTDIPVTLAREFPKVQFC